MTDGTAPRDADEIDDVVDDQNIDGEPEPHSEPPELSAEDREIEARARRSGWFPEEEWDEERAKAEGLRKPRHFKTAKEWLATINDNAKVMRETNRALDGKVAELEGALTKANAKLEDIGKLVENLHRTNTAIGKREYERGKAEALAARKKAIDDSDHEGVARADEILQSLEELKPEAVEQSETQPARQPKTNGEGRETPKASGNPKVDAWVEANRWFTSDQMLNLYVLQEHARLMRETPGADEADLLDDVKEMAKEKFPEKFGINPRRREAPRVGSPAPGGRRGNGHTFADLPPEERAAFKRQQAYMKERNIEYTEKEFLDDYQWGPQA